MDVTALLIFDADCGLCARFAGSRLVRSAQIRAIGYQSIEDDPACARIVRERGIDKRIFTRAMVLIAGDRSWVGARAFNAILSRCGGWRALAAGALSWPLVLPLESLAYGAIAAHRRRISRWIGASTCTIHHHSSLDSSGGSLP